MLPEHRARCVGVMVNQGELSRGQANKLIDAGYQTGRLLRAVTDGELLAIEGIGQATVDKVRAWAGSSK